MLIRFIRNQQSKASLFLLVGFLVFSSLALAFGELFQGPGGALSEQFWTHISAIPWLSMAVFLAMVYAVGMVLFELSREHFLSKFSEAWAPLFFSWNLAALLLFLPLGPSGISLILLTITLWKLIHMYNVKRPHPLVFDAGFLVGLGFLFYPPTLYFLIWIWSGIIIYQFTIWRFVLISLLGALTPILLYSISLYLIDHPEPFVFALEPFLKFGFQYPNWPLLAWPFFVVHAIILLLTSVRLLQKMSKKKIKERKAYLLLFIFLIMTVLTWFLPSANPSQHMIFLALPSALIWSNYFAYEPSNRYTNGFLWIWILSLILLAFA